MIVSTETGGLGNRIKSWASAMRLDADARVVWSRTANMPAAFGELFTNDCEVEQVPEGAGAYCSWRLAVLPNDEQHLPRGFARVGAGAHPLVRGAGKLIWNLRGQPDDTYRYMLFPKQHSRRSTRRDARHIDLEYGRIPAPVIREWVPVFRRIGVRPEILERADQWAGENLTGAVAGVQVRTWRDDPRRQRKYHEPAKGALTRLVAGLPEETRLLVVSDSDQVAGWLAGVAGADRVLEFPRVTAREASWQQPEGIVEDLIDMLLLARLPVLFASYLSTFSETAWWLGGAKADVHVF